MKKKTLYVYRPLVNYEDIKTWASAQGFDKILAEDEMHVTVAYSKTPIYWHYWTDSEDKVQIESGSRSVTPLGDKGAVVLRFESEELQQRWDQFISGGASWDFENYKPHVTITYKNNLDLSKVIPYNGELVFGAERFEEIVEDWQAGIKEVAPKSFFWSNLRRLLGAP